MTKKEFLNLFSFTIQKYNFIKKNNNFYLDCDNDIVCVVGLYKSNFDEYYYIEFGFAIKSINPKIPYPKFSELNINCGLFLLDCKEEIHYENLDHKNFVEQLNKELLMFVTSGKSGINGIRNNYIDKCSYIIGQTTLKYLGVDKSNLIVYPETLWK